MNSKTLRSQFPTLLLLTIGLISSCNSEKTYEDYDEDDFVEVQGIITKCIPARTFRAYSGNNIYFLYHLDKEPPLKGKELKSRFIPTEGNPAIILVHKKDSTVAFFGANGIIDSEAINTFYLKLKQQPKPDTDYFWSLRAE
ncbi:hypothetical protein [Sediminicola luteus]|uniref:Lipoprotein n=1 Tax=Sediminicola luteus TaxID=319238 RepID=A0A2A4GAV5_9FLAO|nr:hypothetical protein [Sediminicola luteus]PCE64895.1 hypothetical protein B7P33_06955 [Sediminicola luteus]